ncbi:hypothetical protein PV326_014064 [Microctonus aethiopoides]|nr:hypothetical protein PV326_014064 [Microctonus aethiopoides]
MQYNVRDYFRIRLLFMKKLFNLSQVPGNESVVKENRKMGMKLRPKEKLCIGAPLMHLNYCGTSSSLPQLRMRGKYCRENFDYINKPRISENWIVCDNCIFIESAKPLVD